MRVANERGQRIHIDITSQCVGRRPIVAPHLGFWLNNPMNWHLSCALRLGGSNNVYVTCLEPLRAFRNIKYDFLSLFKSAEPFRLYRRVVQEDVFAAAILRNESKPFCIVEPLHCTSGHSPPTSYYLCPLIVAMMIISSSRL